MPEYKVTCPKSKRHKRFSVTAHVMQDWEVDEAAEFIDTLDECLEVTHRPNGESSYTCLVCGSQAKAE